MGNYLRYSKGYHVSIMFKLEQKRNRTDQGLFKFKIRLLYSTVLLFIVTNNFKLADTFLIRLL